MAVYKLPYGENGVKNRNLYTCTHKKEEEEKKLVRFFPSPPYRLY